MIAGLILVALVALGGWIFGSQRSGEFADVMNRVRAGAQQLQDLLSLTGQFILSRLSSTSVSVTDLFGTVVTTFITALEALIVIVMSAAYFAAESALYRAGLIRLFGPAHEERTTPSSPSPKRSGTGCWDNSFRWRWLAF